MIEEYLIFAERVFNAYFVVVYDLVWFAFAEIYISVQTRMAYDFTLNYEQSQGDVIHI